MAVRGRETILPSLLHPYSPGWPGGLTRLGGDAPTSLLAYGEATLLGRPLLGLFCSQRVPGRVVVDALELAQALADAGVSVVSGFQSPVEREVLSILLGGGGGIVLCPARALGGMAVRAAWRQPLRAGRMLLLSASAGGQLRPSVALAVARNRLVAALSHRALVLHAAPGGQLWQLTRELVGNGIPLDCLEHPANADLCLLGATPIRPPRTDAAGPAQRESYPWMGDVTGHGPCHQ